MLYRPPVICKIILFLNAFKITRTIKILSIPKFSSDEVKYLDTMPTPGKILIMQRAEL